MLLFTIEFVSPRVTHTYLGSGALAVYNQDPSNILRVAIRDDTSRGGWRGIGKREIPRLVKIEQEEEERSRARRITIELIVRNPRAR